MARWRCDNMSSCYPSCALVASSKLRSPIMSFFLLSSALKRSHQMYFSFLYKTLTSIQGNTSCAFFTFMKKKKRISDRTLNNNLNLCLSPIYARLGKSSQTTIRQPTATKWMKNMKHSVLSIHLDLSYTLEKTHKLNLIDSSTIINTIISENEKNSARQQNVFVRLIQLIICSNKSELFHILQSKQNLEVALGSRKEDQR